MMSELTAHNFTLDGRGFVKINDSEAFALSEPYTVNSRSGEEEPVYMMSVFHQLHCLVRSLPKHTTECEKWPAG